MNDPARGETLRLLIAEDSENDTVLVLRELRKAGYAPAHLRVDSAQALRAALAAQAWDIVLADFRMPGFGGSEALAIVRASGDDLPFVLVSGQIGEEAAVEIMKAGAQDYVMKDRLSRLGPVVRRELADAAARRGMKRAQIEWTAAFDAVRDPIFFHDADFRVVRANLAYAAHAGMPITEVIGKPYWEVFPRRDGPLPGCLRSAHADSAAFEEEFTLPDGETFSSRSFGINDERGQFVHELHVLQDVTERNRAREALQRSERHARKLIEGSADIFYVLDRDHRLTFRSDSSRHLTGWDDRDFIGGTLLDQVVSGDWPLAEKMLADAESAANARASVDLRLSRKDAPPIHVEAHARNLLDDPDVNGIVVTLHDISERERAERAIRNVNRALLTLIAGDEAMIRATDETSLLQGMCDAIVAVGKYQLTWVGMARHDPEKSIDVVAYGGPMPANVSKLRPSWSNEASGGSITGAAIREGVRQVVHDLKSESKFLGSELRAAIFATGARSVVAFPLRVEGNVIGALSITYSESGNFDENEMKVLEQLAGDLAYGIGAMRAQVHVREAAVQLRRSLESTVEAIAATVESRDPYTAGHERRVALLAEAMARELGLPEPIVEGIHFGAMIHDLGKIQIPAEILSKLGKLSSIQFDLVKGHPQAGYDILEGIKFPWPVKDMVHQHHERLDGSGYPQGLKGDEIILEARIIAVADVVEAMASHRPYRPGLGIPAALEEIRRGRGTAYDAPAVDACVRLFEERGYVLPD